MTPARTVTGRYCCKSIFALLSKNSLGCRRDCRVKMWGTSSVDRKLIGDLRNAIESTEIDGRRSRRPLAGKLSPGDFRLLQQYRPQPDSCSAAKPTLYSITSSARPRSEMGMVRPSALAVLRLMISSTLVDCWIGGSAGFSPLRMRAV